MLDCCAPLYLQCTCKTSANTSRQQTGTASVDSKGCNEEASQHELLHVIICAGIGHFDVFLPRSTQTTLQGEALESPLSGGPCTRCRCVHGAESPPEWSYRLELLVPLQYLQNPPGSGGRTDSPVRTSRCEASTSYSPRMVSLAADKRIRWLRLRLAHPFGGGRGSL